MLHTVSCRIAEGNGTPHQLRLRSNHGETGLRELFLGLHDIDKRPDAIFVGIER